MKNNQDTYIKKDGHVYKIHMEDETKIKIKDSYGKELFIGNKEDVVRWTVDRELNK